MASVFPDTSVNNPDTGFAWADGDIWNDPDSGLTYSWYNPVWKTGGAGAEGNFVQIDGDNMTGDLTLGTDKITLDATTGAGAFTRLALRPTQDGDAYIQAINQDTGKTVANFFGNGSINLSSDLTSNTNIALNGSDGSASFAGGIDASQYLIVDRDINGEGAVLSSFGNNTGTKCLIKGDGTYIGTALTGGNGTITGANITLNASGTGTFSGPVYDAGWASSTDRDGYYVGHGGIYVAKQSGLASGVAFGVYSGAQTSTSGDNRTVTITGSGSAEFAGDIIAGDGQPYAAANLGTRIGNNGVISTTSSATNSVFLGYLTGSANQTSEIRGDGTISNGTLVASGGVGTRINPSGSIGLRNDISTTSPVFQAFRNGTTTSDRTVLFNNDGSAEFASGAIELLANGSVYSSNRIIAGSRASAGAGGFSQAYGITAYSRDGATGSHAAVCGQNFSNGGRVWSGVDTAGTLTSEIFEDGTISGKNVTFNLEAGDDTKYTSTTDSEGNETRVYNGAVLDVKDRLQNVLARMDAIEANEITDDATDSALLTLIANLSARLDERDTAIAALTTRIETLES